MVNKCGRGGNTKACEALSDDSRCSNLTKKDGAEYISFDYYTEKGLVPQKLPVDVFAKFAQLRDKNFSDARRLLVPRGFEDMEKIIEILEVERNGNVGACWERIPELSEAVWFMYGNEDSANAAMFAFQNTPRFPDHAALALKLIELTAAEVVGMWMTKKMSLRDMAVIVPPDVAKEGDMSATGKYAFVGDPPRLKQIIAVLNDDSVEIDGMDSDRREWLAGELQKISEESQGGKADSMSLWQKIATGAGILGGLVGIGSLFFMKSLRDLNKRMIEKQEEKIDAKEFLQDMTEAARKKGFVPPQVDIDGDIETMEDATQKPIGRNLVVSGPAGEGKSQLVKAFMSKVAMGGVEHLEGYLVYRLNVAKMEALGAKYVGMMGKVMAAFLEEIKGKKALIWVEEAQTMAGIGTSEGKSSDVLEGLKPTMLDPNNEVIFIFDTNTPERFENDEALASRTTPVKKEPADVRKTRAALDARLANGMDLKGLSFSEEARQNMVWMARMYQAGWIRAAVDHVLQEVIARAKREKVTGELSGDQVIELFARYNKLNVEDLRTAMARIAGMSEEEHLKLREFVKGKDIKTVCRMLAEMSRRPPNSPSGGGAGPTGRPNPPSGGSATGGGGAGTGQPDIRVEKTGTFGGPGKDGTSSTRQITEEPVVARAGVAERVGKLSKGSVGFAAGVLPFAVAEAAEKAHVITEGQKGAFDAGALLAMTFANPFTPAHLALMAAPFEAGRLATDMALEATGVEALGAERPAGAALGVVGGFAATAAVVRATGGAEVWHQAAVTLQNGVLGGIGTAIETTVGAVRDQAQNMVIGARMYGQQAATAATAIATSAVIWGRAALPVVEKAGAAAGKALVKRLAQAGLTSLADGPLPVGEVVGIGLIAGGVIEAGFEATFAVMDAMEE